MASMNPRHAHPLVVRKRPRARALLSYTAAILYEFRWTLLLLGVLIAIGAALYTSTPHAAFEGHRADLLTAVYGAWMAMLAQPITAPPQPWHLTVVAIVYPIFGFLLIGEGVVRLALLLMSRRHGEKEWMRVMAATYRDHIVLCGLGHLGYRVFEHLVESHIDVVVIEMNEDNRFLAQARATGGCILIRDMKDDQSLIDAGIERASGVIIATNDDMGNLEVAMDARRLNKGIHIMLRLFDQRIAQKIAGALTIDAAFSASALAAPIVAAMALRTRVLSSTVIAGIPHSVFELQIDRECPLAGKRIDEIETGYSAKVLAKTSMSGQTQSPPSPAVTAQPGDSLIIHASTTQIATIAAAGRKVLV
jgi:Trk K+ transport system NAD-binding subunit